MKKYLIIFMIMILLIGTAACSDSNNATPDHTSVETSIQSVPMTEAVQTEALSSAETNNPAPSDPVQATEKDSDFDPYATENEYDVNPALFERQSGTDYGTLQTGVEYFSTTADDYKQVNILLPPGYDANSAYPVLYMIHGWGGNYAAHLSEGSYLHMLYGNLYRDGLAEPMIIVGVDMYTGKQDVKDTLDGWKMREAYDRTVDDIAVDLMSFLKTNYAVAEARENTAVAGVSEGGAKSLCTGFQWLDRIGYIAGFAPDGNVIPIGENYRNSYWTLPYFDTLPQPTEETTPIYLYLAVGSEDPWNIYGTGYYSDVLDEMGVRHQFDYVEGYGHNSDFWRVCMYNYIKKIFK